MISIEALALLLLGLNNGRWTTAGFIGQYFRVVEADMLKWSLTVTGFAIDMIAILGFIYLLIREYRGLSAAQRYRIIVFTASLSLALAALFLGIGRYIYGSPYGTHDGAVQSEVAGDMLRRGINPYQANFKGTEFTVFHQPHFGDKTNPVLDHYPYPPLILIANTVLVTLAHLTHLPADSRLLTSAAMIWLLWYWLRQTPDAKTKTWIALLTVLNPLVTFYPLVGFNDILFVIPMLLSAATAARGRWLASGVLMGLALAAKQTAWLALPLWLVWLWRQSSNSSHRMFWRPAAAALLVVTVFYLPFIIWNAGAMWDDLVRFVSGAIPSTFPISGDSWWQFLVIFRYVPTPWVTNAAWPWELLAMAVAYPLGIWWLAKRATAVQWLTSSILVITVVSLANRYFNENYISAIVTLIIGAVILNLRHPTNPPAEPVDRKQ